MLKALAFVSIMVALLSLGIFIRSFERRDIVVFVKDFPSENHLTRYKLVVESARGGMCIQWTHWKADNPVAIAELNEYYKWHPRGIELKPNAGFFPNTSYFSVQGGLHPLGFEFTRHKGIYLGTPWSRFTLSVPYWALFAGALIWPACWIMKGSRRKRSRGFTMKTSAASENDIAESSKAADEIRN